MDKNKIPRWHCNKRWTDLNKTREALSVLESPTFEGKTWTGLKQSYYAILLNQKGLSSSVNPRSTRAILAAFKFFGFAWTRNKIVVVTPAGKDFVHRDVSSTLKRQLLKWQYPNPFESKGNVAPYTRALRIFPIRTLLGLLRRIGPLSEDELALFVWKTTTEEVTELERIESEIEQFRRLSEEQVREVCENDPLFVTNHEYEAHLRPYMLATGLFKFDSESRLLSIDSEAMSEVNRILSESVKVKTDWEDEEEWFEYFGDTKYSHPPRKVKLRFMSRRGPAASIYVQLGRNGTAKHSISDEDGSAWFDVYENVKYDLKAISSDGKTLVQRSIRFKPGTDKMAIRIRKAPKLKKDTADDLIEKLLQLVTRNLDDEIRERIEMRSRIEGKRASRKHLRAIRGGRFEELVFRLLKLYRAKIFDDVVWNGRTGDWGLPIPAQKVSQETGKKLPDILVFQDDYVYVVETTLLKGRAQWEKPEAVSVPDHIENMISEYKGKSIFGIFIATKLDRSVQESLVTRAVNHGYRIVPVEVDEFIQTIRMFDVSKRDLWRTSLDNSWDIHRRLLTRRKK